MSGQHLVQAQSLGGRGFIDLKGTAFPQDVPTDGTNVVGDALVRAEGFAKPGAGIQFAGGVDVRANTHRQVDWGAFDAAERRLTRSGVALRRLSATWTSGPLTLDVGKQFIRWGKTDLVTPTDRLAPRDFLEVLTPEFLPVTAVRAGLGFRRAHVEAAWIPWFTPSRMPVLDQRWAPTAAGLPAVQFQSGTARFPTRSQVGIRWSATVDRFDYAVSYFDGFNNAPTLVPEVPHAALVPASEAGALVGDTAPTLSLAPSTVRLNRRYQALRTYGADAAVPTPWLTAKVETAFFSAPDGDADEFVLYVVQLERQVGEWLLIGGYAGEVVTENRELPLFMPERSMTRSLIAKVSYTIDVRRSAAAEAAVRQNGDGLYLKGELSEAYGQHWRMSVAAVLLRGAPADFLGQFRRNSHLAASLRYSF